MNTKLLVPFLLICSMLSLTGCKNIFGGGEDSSTADSGFAPGLDPIPPAFTLFDVSQASEQATLNWQKPDYALTFSVYYKVSGANNFTKISNVQPPYLLTGLTNGVTYDVKVEAANARGSRFSDVIQIRPTANTSNYSLKAGETVLASTQLQHTSQSYTVSGSLIRGLASEVKATTSTHGYTLYLTSQGNLIGGAQ